MYAAFPNILTLEIDILGNKELLSGRVPLLSMMSIRGHRSAYLYYFSLLFILHLLSPNLNFYKSHLKESHLIDLILKITENNSVKNTKGKLSR